MSDIALDLDPASANFGDWRLVDGDFVLVDGADAILQDIVQRIRWFFGEWFLDITGGVPWFQQIFVKGYDQAKVDAILQNTILGTPGVTQLTSYSFSVNASTRQLSVTFSAQTTSGTVNYGGPIP